MIGALPAHVRSHSVHTWTSARLGLLALITTALILAGCTVGPDYLGPPSVTPRADKGAPFVRQVTAKAKAAQPADAWWTALKAPDLTRLVEKAYANSPTLQAALARVRGARATVAQNNAKLYPSGSFTGAVLANRFGTQGLGSSLSSALASPALSGAASAAGATGGALSIPNHVDLDVYDSTFDATWELDIFGGKRRQVEQAIDQAEGSVDQLQNARVQLAAEVGRAYVNLRDAQHRLALQAHSADVERESLSLTQQRVVLGTSTLVDVERLRTQLTSTEAQIPSIKAQVDEALDELAYLTGEEPGALDAALRKAKPVPLPPRRVAIGDPAALIRRRPDIRAAERTLAANSAMIGQSVAQMFPKVTLLGNVGYVAFNQRSFGNANSFTYDVGPTLQWNLLDFGRTLASIRGSQAGFDEALANYRQTVLSALNDSETALSRFGHQREAVAQLEESSAAAEKAASLTHDRNKAGTVSLIDTLDVERQRLQAEQSLAQGQAQLTNAYISLQINLGLGWAASRPEDAPEPASDAGTQIGGLFEQVTQQVSPSTSSQAARR